MIQDGPRYGRASGYDADTRCLAPRRNDIRECHLRHQDEREDGRDEQQPPCALIVLCDPLHPVILSHRGSRDRSATVSRMPPFGLSRA
jgi:hypothetical protein